MGLRISWLNPISLDHWMKNLLKYAFYTWSWYFWILLLTYPLWFSSTLPLTCCVCGPLSFRDLFFNNGHICHLEQFYERMLELLPIRKNQTPIMLLSPREVMAATSLEMLTDMLTSYLAMPSSMSGHSHVLGDADWHVDLIFGHALFNVWPLTSLNSAEPHPSKLSSLLSTLSKLLWCKY